MLIDDFILTKIHIFDCVRRDLSKGGEVWCNYDFRCSLSDGTEFCLMDDRTPFDELENEMEREVGRGWSATAYGQMLKRKTADSENALSFFGSVIGKNLTTRDEIYSDEIRSITEAKCREAGRDAQPNANIILGIIDTLAYYDDVVKRMIERCEQEQEPTAQLPDVLNTEKVRKVIAEAMKRGWLTENGGHYEWHYNDGKSEKTTLAYFWGKAFGFRYCEEYGSRNSGANVPWVEFQKLFGETKMHDNCCKAWEAKKPQPWRKQIDEFFDFLTC